LDNRLKEIRYEKSNLKEENDNLMKKLESLMEEHRSYISNLEKENKELEDKLTSVNI